MLLIAHSEDRKPQISTAKGAHFMQDVNMSQLNLYDPAHFMKPSPSHLTATLQGRKEGDFCLSGENTAAQGVGLSEVPQLVWEATFCPPSECPACCVMLSVWGQAPISGAVSSQGHGAALSQQAQGPACAVPDPST